MKCRALFYGANLLENGTRQITVYYIGGWAKAIEVVVIRMEEEEGSA